ncbi:MAG: biopolymer transporter ExbD [Fibrobacteres bacterium]|nr:biopolymer transporter ExbD [Fibrobacterota bacterium]
MAKKKNVRKKRGAQGAAELELTPMMNLFSNLIPFLLLTASFASIKILDVKLPEANLMTQQQQQKDPDDEGLLLTVFITDEGVTLGAKGAMLPTTYVREYHKYLYSYPLGSANKETYLQKVTKENKKELPMCPLDPTRKLTMFERDEIILYAIDRNSESDTGTILKCVKNKLDETMMFENGQIFDRLPKAGDTLYVLSLSTNRRMEIVKDPSEYVLKELTLYEQLASRLLRIRGSYPDVPDAGEIKLVAEDDVVFDKIIHIMDVCRDFGFDKISLAKLAG